MAEHPIAWIAKQAAHLPRFMVMINIQSGFRHSRANRTLAALLLFHQFKFSMCEAVLFPQVLFPVSHRVRRIARTGISAQLVPFFLAVILASDALTFFAPRFPAITRGTPVFVKIFQRF